MRITIFGATGRTGSHLVSCALARGHTVRAVSRDLSAAAGRVPENPALTWVRCDVTDAAQVLAAVEGADAVLSALGVPNFREPGTLLPDAARHIVAAMAHWGVKRLVGLAGAGILDVTGGGGMLRNERPGFPTVFKPVSAAHKAVWDVLASSGGGLVWTLACTPDLKDEPAGDRVLLEAANCLPASTNEVAAGAVAEWMVREAEEPRFPQARVGLCF